MAEGCIPKDPVFLYGELALGYKVVGSPQIHFKDICICDMKTCNIDIKPWEVIAEDKTLRKKQVSHGLR